MRLPYTEFFATYEVVTPFRIPAHPGSLWRGVIGRALRREGCARQSVCQDSCQLPSACLYQKLFDPPMPQPAPHRFLRGQKEAPPPLVPIVAWSGSQQLLAGDSVRIGLRCLGVLSESEKECLVRVLAAVSQARLGRDEGRVELVAVSAPVSDEKTASVREGLAAQRDSFSVRIQLLSPLWLEQEGRLLTQIDFPRLFTDLMRRLTMLCALYGTHDPDDDDHFVALRTVASEVQVRNARLSPLHWERHSTQSDTRHPLHGVIGELLLHGPLRPFLPFLRLGEVAHIGKSASMGLGRIECSLLPEVPAEPPDSLRGVFSLDPARETRR